MLMQVAFCDFLSGLLGRGMRGSLKASKKGGVKCYFWLDPLHYIPIVIYISSRGVIRIAPWPPNLPTTTTTLLIFDAVAMAAPSTLPASPTSPPLSAVVVWSLTCDPGRGRSSGVTAGRGHYVWGTTRRVTWSVGVATSCKRDVHTATTTTPLLLYRNLSPYQYQHTADTHRGGQAVMIMMLVVMMTLS